jgi:hypothetical protein
VGHPLLAKQAHPGAESQRVDQEHEFVNQMGWQQRAISSPLPMMRTSSESSSPLHQKPVALAATRLGYGRPPMTTTLYISITTTTATTMPTATRYRPKKYATTAAHAPTAAISPPLM